MMFEELKTSIGGVKETILNTIRGWWLAQFNAQITYHGVRIDLSSEVVSNKIRGAFVRNRYETGELQLIDEYLRRDVDLIELGGGIGFTAAYADRQLSPESTHVVVEANEDLIPIIEETKLLNQSNFFIEHAAYAPGQDRAEFHRHPHFWSGSTASETSVKSTVTGTDLASLRNDYQLEQFALIVDIEGAEVELLHELSLIERVCTCLIIEFHDRKSEHVDVAEDIGRVRRALDDSLLDLVWSDATKGVYINRKLTV